MSDETAPIGDAVSYAVPADAPAEMTVSDAARLLSQSRRARQEAPPAESAEPAIAEEPELAAQADADPSQDPGEIETQESEPADLPPIEAPRSWTKEEKEAFKVWPREAQESIARVASTREADFRRSQNEAAEAKKALDARMAQAEEVRKQYEARLPHLVKTIETTMQQEFGDIQSIADARKMQAEDPFRFQAWQLRQMELASAQKEQGEAQQRQSNERNQNLLKYRGDETKKVEEYFPDLKDPEKLKDSTKKAIDHLRSFDLSDEQLNEYADQGDKPFIFSAAFQRILLNSLKYEEAQKAPAKVVRPNLPPVSKPGTAKGGNPSLTLQIQNLNTQLSNASGKEALMLAAKLTALRRSSAR